MLDRSHWLLLGLSALLAAGCAFTQVGRLYQMSTGQSSEIQSCDPVIRRGNVLAKLPDGSSCRGGVGAIEPRNAREVLNSATPFSDNAEAGVALLRCSSGDVLRCTFAGRPGRGLSYGTCRDQREIEYAVIF